MEIFTFVDSWKSIWVGVWGAEVCLSGRSNGLPGLQPYNKGFYSVPCEPSFLHRKY